MKALFFITWMMITAGIVDVCFELMSAASTEKNILGVDFLFIWAIVSLRIRFGIKIAKHLTIKKERSI